jgi:competence protein ComEC
MFCIGFCYASVMAGYVLSHRMPLQQSGSTGTAIVEIIGLPEEGEQRWRFQGRLLASDDFSGLLGRTITLSWYRTHTVIQPGDVWRFQVLLRTPNGVLNPGGHDAEQHALRQRIAAQGYVKGHAERISAHASIDRFRHRLSQNISKSLPVEQARFVQALALGDTRGLSAGDWELMRHTGITHLIAISGFHVGMVAVFAVWCFSGAYHVFPRIALRMTRITASAWVSMLAAWAYTALAGFAIPTVRTALMISVFMLCRLLFRHVAIGQAVCLSLLAILLMDPLSILSPGFWLSFCGVLSLILFMPDNRHGGVLKPFVRAQGVVSLALLPISIGFFNQTTVIGPLVNLLAIPWISLLVVPLALLGCLIAWLPAASSILWQGAAWSMQGLWSLLIVAQNQNWAVFYSAEPSIAIILLALLGAAVCLLPNGVPCKWLGLFLLLPMLDPKPVDIPQGQIRVAMIDVGQGLSMLIRTRQHALLYDTGAGNGRGFSRGESAVLPALRSMQVSRLDKVVISHSDNDHSGGLPAIQTGMPIDGLQASYRLQGASLCRAGQHWTWDGVRFQYLWPRDGSSTNDNDKSCVLRIVAGGRSLLLTGDISRSVETQLLAAYGPLLASEIIVVPHHGSRTSSSAEFLRAVNPKLALVSSGFQNRFRHPNLQVVQRYRMQGAELVNSVENGWTELEGGPNGWRWLLRARIDSGRYWHRNPLQDAAESH